MRDVSYGLRKELPNTDLNTALERVTAALKAEGFGILTKIDVRATLKEKLNIDHKPYIILGACNPQLAHQALTADDNIGLLLPCNVVVAEAEHGVEVAIARPEAMFAIVDNAAVQPVAKVAEERLGRVIQNL